MTPNGMLLPVTVTPKKRYKESKCKYRS